MTLLQFGGGYKSLYTPLVYAPVSNTQLRKTLCIFASGMAVFGRLQPGHESLMPLLSFSL